MDSIVFGLSLIIVLGAVLSYIFSKFKQPLITAFILTGFIIGPAVFGLVRNYETIQAFSQIGIAFLLYAVGAELSIDKIKNLNKNIYLVTIFEVFGTFGLGLLLSHFLLGFSWLISVFIGSAVGMSSTAVVMKYMSDQKLINTLKSRIMLGILLVQDLIIMLFLPLLLDVNNFSIGLIPLVLVKIVVLIVAAVLLNYVFTDILKESFKRKDLLFLVSLASCFVFIGLSVLMDFSIIIGAFIGGLIITNYPYKLEVIEQIDETKSFFSMLFFVSLGMQITDISAINWVLFLVLFALTVVIKPLIMFIGTLFSGYDETISFYVASGLFQVSAFSLVLVQFATLNNIFDESLSTTLILFISLGMMFTPYVLSKNKFLEKLFHPVNKYITKFTFRKRKQQLSNVEEKKFSNHVVLFGLGRMGSGVLSGLLDSELVKKENLVVVDDDPEVVLDAIKNGIYGLCGQADNKEILHRLDLHKARAIIITIPYYDVNKVILKHVNMKKTPIFMRAYYVQEALEYYKKGIKYVAVPQVLATNEILKDVYGVLSNEGSSDALNELFMSTMKRYSKEETFNRKTHRYSVE